MKNLIIESVMLLDAILFAFSLCAVSAFCNAISIALLILSVLIFGWFVIANKEELKDLKKYLKIK